MNTTIVHSSAPVTLLGGGDLKSLDIKNVLDLAPTLVAADGGASAALEAGLIPAATIGDLDSLPGEAVADLGADRVFLIAEQDSTDFDKAMRNIRAPLVIGLGFLGARLDHQLASLHTLLVRRDRPCLLVGESEVVFHALPHMLLPTETGDTVSFFPLGPVTATADGLEWPLDQLRLAPGGRIGTSNRAIGPVLLRVDQPGLIVILPRHRLTAVTRAILQQPSRWSVPA